MPELSRSQLVVYGAVAVALLLVGARWLRDADEREPPDRGIAALAEGSGEGESFAIEDGAGGVVVHVAGAVREPGVYRMPAGSRVADAIERAGGESASAAADAINLAAELADGQQVVVPADAPGPGTATTATGVSEGPISVATATPEQLETIEGIGPVTAASIIEFRDQNGVGSIDDLDQISGIGPATMEALRGGLQP